jgi:hypothetical protein
MPARDIGSDFAAALSEFRAVLSAVAAKDSTIKGMGLYGVAMTVGRQALGGFAPVAGVAGPPTAQKSRVAGSVGEAGFVAARGAGSQADAGPPAVRNVGGAQTSYRAVVAQARSQAAVGRARREAEGAMGWARRQAEGVVLHLPGRGAALAGLSFAPPPGVRAVEGHLFRSGIVGGNAPPGLLRPGSVHGAVSVAEAAFAGDGKAGIGAAGNRRVGSGEAGGQQFAAAAASAPPVVAPADIERALESYFFRQSRLPPVGGAGFNPMLSPVWAGLKIPG